MTQPTEATPKMEWETPELILLARGNPEESVVLSCISLGGDSGGGGALASTS